MVTQDLLRRMVAAAAAKKAAETTYAAARAAVTAGFADRAVEPGPLTVREVTARRQHISLADVVLVLGQPAADRLVEAVEKTAITYLTVVPATTPDPQVPDDDKGKTDPA